MFAITLSAPLARGEEEGSADDSWSPFANPPLTVKKFGDDGEPLTLAEKLWSLPVLYSNPKAPLFQEIRLIGRLHGQYSTVSASQGSWDGWDERRRRLGLVVDFLQDFRIRFQAKGDGETSVFDEESLEDVWVTWRPESLGLDWLSVEAGQFKPLWSYEWGLSSNTMPTIERTQFVNQFLPNRAGGARVGLRSGPWRAALSAFSGDLDNGFGNDEGIFSIFNIGYDLTEQFGGWDSLNWRLDYVHNDGSNQITEEQAYRHALSTSIAGSKGRWSAAVDLMFVDGDSDAFGFMVLPTYELIEDKLELAMRYSFSTASDDILTLQQRYEQEIADGLGDRYHSVYAGLNWFIYGHRLKLMTGLEYSTMDSSDGSGDFDGWTFVSALRFWF